jgi:thioredoxin-like negative regulator of GroEL
MFQIVLSLIAGILIGWNFHIFFTALEPKKVPKCDSNKSKIVYIERPQPKATAPKLVCKPIIRVLQKESNISKEGNKSRELSPFEKLLKSGNFDDAMAFYMEADDKKLKEYRLILKVYFYDRADKFPKKTIEQMLQFIDIESKTEDIKLYLAKLYRERGDFPKAIKLLFELRDSEDVENLKFVKHDLDKTIETYIKRLKNGKNFQKLISLLEDMISKDGDNQKYIIRLAKLYYKLDDYEKAEKILEEIDSDSTYSAKADTILTQIEQKQIELRQYTHKIPIIKIGSQYGIDVLINNIPLRLLLDTGATYTFIDEDKIFYIDIEKEILLSTAGGDIIAHIAYANSLNLQDIELKNFKITIAPFSQNGVDGLLGMNFFEKFNFKIDQNEKLLYLKKKKAQKEESIFLGY